MEQSAWGISKAFNAQTLQYGRKAAKQIARGKQLSANVKPTSWGTGPTPKKAIKLGNKAGTNIERGQALKQQIQSPGSFRDPTNGLAHNTQRAHIQIGMAKPKPPPSSGGWV